MSVIYREEDADLSHLADKIVAIIGYGSLGRPVALNLRDSGINVVVGARSDDSRQAAVDDGLRATTIEEAVRAAHVIFMMLPDEVMPPFYLEQVSPHLHRGHMLVFTSGYNMAFRYIEPPAFVDVGLIAPRILGAGVRERYESGEGFYSFLAVGQDATGNAWSLLLALAAGMGALRAGASEVTFEREVELDLFMQQAVMPALHHVLTTAAELLLARGYPAEAAFTELYLSGELTYYLNQVTRAGLLNTLQKTPLTHQYGTVSRLDRFSDLKLERLMEVTLNEIHEGAFAREWSKEYEAGSRRLNSFYKNQEGREVWEFEQQTVEALGLTDDLEA